MAGWVYNTGSNDPPTSGPKITSIAIVLTTLSLLCLSARFYVRLVMIKAMGADDWAALVSWIGCLGFAIVSIIQTKWGLGLSDLNTMPDENVYTFGLLQFIGAPFYITSILFFKLALLLSYLRILPKGIWRTLTYITIVGCTLFHISFLVVQINLCSPVNYQWDTSVGGTCLPSVTVYTTLASLTIVFDVIVMCLPIPTIIRLQINNRKKLVLVTLLLLGLFITVIQIIRIQTIKSLSNLLDSDQLIMWSTVENNLGLIVACVPTLSPLFKAFRGSTRRGNTSSRDKSNPTFRSTSYALQSWGKGGTQGFKSLDSNGDVQAHIGRSEAQSTESILGTGRDAGIVRKTEVTITSQAARPTASDEESL